MRKYILTLLLAAGAAIAVQAAGTMTPAEMKLLQAQKIIERFYVDEVNADSIVEEAIRAMLKTLDPHSTYSTPSETRELNEPLQGNFSGIGIQYNMLNDTLYVIQTIAGGPSERVGILAGDRILMANDTLIAGVKMDKNEIMRRLRGPKGTKVSLDVLRGKDRIDFVVTRDDIPLYSVDASYMVDKTTGYVRISRFAADTSEEVRRAMRDLKKQGMKNIIIDLEYNGGGYLSSAFKIGNIFLDKGDLIVYTDNSKDEPVFFNAESHADFPEGRVVVMVNQYSASASEILAGAIQDHDRGVIVGRRSFGKGLVQRPFDFADGSMIRLTTSRYHTPSGRCIQKPYDSGDGDYSRDIINRYHSGELTDADSIRFNPELLYHTEGGREVYGGGGIMPDLFVPLDTLHFTNYYRDLMAKGLFNRVAMNYVDANRADLKKKYPTVAKLVAGFAVPEQMMTDLVEEGEKEGVEYNAEQMALSRDYIMRVLKALVARDIFDTGAYYQVINESNPVFREAVRIINSPAEYNNLLRP